MKILISGQRRNPETAGQGHNDAMAQKGHYPMIVSGSPNLENKSLKKNSPAIEIAGLNDNGSD